MTSIIVQMISIMTVIAITGEAVDLQIDKDFKEISEGCPYMENAEYDVTVKGSVSSLIGGCAYISYNASNTMTQSYSLWFGNIQHDGPHCRGNGIEYFLFYCLSKPLSPSTDVSKGRMYINKVWLYGEAANKTGTRDRRCALYEKINNHDKTLRVAISSDVSCDGLSDILYNPQLIHRHNKGSMLLIFNKTKHDAPITTTESIQSISKRYERRGYILQDFGNRPNPFWRKEEKDRRRRHVLQISDGDDRHSAVIDLANYNGSQLNGNAKDATIKDKNWSRRPLEINNKLRRKRSVTSTSKTNVTVLAGVNPFSLMLSNRVHNNNTGSIKPLGLWDQIVNLFKI